MNQLCKVCGEPAAGFHFGAFTCEGCKSFFGRTYNNISSISECKNNGECVINKKNRTACKACRLRKCLLVGMSKSGSRYGRRSNWFKIHCLLQERQQQQHQQQQLVGVGVPQPPPPVGLLRPHPYLSPLFATPTTTGPLFREASGRSSESDSGASSADPEDDVRSTSTLGYLKPSSSPGSDYYASKKLSPSSDSEFFVRKRPTKPAPPSPASLPSVSPSGVVPKWLPPIVGISDPSSWRETWTKVVAATPAPDQDQPIDLSVKKEISTKEEVKCEEDGVLDLTLDRQMIDVDGVSKG